MGKLYGETIKALACKAKAGQPLDAADAELRLRNPMCGDEVTVRINISDGHVQVGYRVQGCLICMASCARMAEIVSTDGDSVKLKGLVNTIESMFKNGTDPREMEEFVPVRERRSRHECVVLPFRALGELLRRRP